jgi:hypothetical protein
VARQEQLASRITRWTRLGLEAIAENGILIAVGAVGGTATRGVG